MSDQNDFLDFFRKQYPNWVKDEFPTAAYIWGTVVEVSTVQDTLVRIQRSDEAFADNQFWPTLGPYTPEVNDRVLCARVDGGLMVLGPLNKEGIVTLFDPHLTLPAANTYSCNPTSAFMLDLTGSRNTTAYTTVAWAFEDGYVYRVYKGDGPSSDINSRLDIWDTNGGSFVKIVDYLDLGVNTDNDLGDQVQLHVYNHTLMYVGFSQGGGLPVAIDVSNPASPVVGVGSGVSAGTDTGDQRAQYQDHLWVASFAFHVSPAHETLVLSRYHFTGSSASLVDDTDTSITISVNIFPAITATASGRVFVGNQSSDFLSLEVREISNASVSIINSGTIPLLDAPDFGESRLRLAATSSGLFAFFQSVVYIWDLSLNFIGTYSTVDMENTAFPYVVGNTIYLGGLVFDTEGTEIRQRDDLRVYLGIGLFTGCYLYTDNDGDVWAVYHSSNGWVKPVTLDTCTHTMNQTHQRSLQVTGLSWADDILSVGDGTLLVRSETTGSGCNVAKLTITGTTITETGSLDLSRITFFTGMHRIHLYNGFLYHLGSDADTSAILIHKIDYSGAAPSLVSTTSFDSQGMGGVTWDNGTVYVTDYSADDGLLQLWSLQLDTMVRSPVLGLDTFKAKPPQQYFQGAMTAFNDEVYISLEAQVSITGPTFAIGNYPVIGRFKARAGSKPKLRALVVVDDTHSYLENKPLANDGTYLYSALGNGANTTPEPTIYKWSVSQTKPKVIASASAIRIYPTSSLPMLYGKMMVDNDVLYLLGDWDVQSYDTSDLSTVDRMPSGELVGATTQVTDAVVYDGHLLVLQDYKTGRNSPTSEGSFIQVASI